MDIGYQNCPQSLKICPQVQGQKLRFESKFNQNLISKLRLQIASPDLFWKWFSQECNNACRFVQ